MGMHPVLLFNFGDYLILAIPAISWLPSPLTPIPDWRAFETGHPNSSQIGVHFSDLFQIGVELAKD